MKYYIVTTWILLKDCKLKKIDTREYIPYTSIYMKFKTRQFKKKREEAKSTVDRNSDF